ncbi:MAG: hypothetical protein EXR75_16605 [Myxococcales bacterium]|nr:hypothetical protein [Myxococcales bacterium]
MTDESNRNFDAGHSLSLGRALHVGFIGLGQCGGNLAEAFARREYPAIALNTSQADLRSLSHLADAQKILIGDERFGSGGSLTLGGEALRASSEKIEEAVLRAFEDVEIVVVAAGLGGGTGGNLAELINLLAAHELPVVALGALPGEGEGHRTKTNALWALNELVESDAESIILVDNEKLFEAHAAATVTSFMRECNEALVTSFDQLNRISNDDRLRSLRTFDPNDLRQLLRFGGVTVFGSRALDGALNRETLGTAFAEIINQNEILAGSFEPTDVVTIGSIIAASERLLAGTPASAFDAYTREIKRITNGAMHRTGLYASDAKESRLYVIAAGLPLPSRTRDLLGEATDESKIFGAKKQAARGKLKKLDLSALGMPTDPIPSNGGRSAARAPDVELDVADVDEAELVEAVVSAD